MPDSNFDFATASTVELQLFIATLHNKIIVMVGCACRKYKRFASPDKISDITQEVTCLLLKNDCHALRTYYAERSKFPTWLNTVVEHEVTRDSQKAHPVEPLEDILSSMLRCAPTQEQELLQKERLALLYEEIKKLRPHNQSIAYMKLREIPSEEIAQHLKIKAASVEREWRVIKIKLVHSMAEGKERKGKEKCDAP